MPDGIASLISDFSSPGPADGFGLAVLRRVKQVQEEEVVHVPSAADRQAELIQSAVAKALAEEQAAAQRRLEAALEEERKRHLEELAAQREIWVQQEALQLSSQIVEAIGNLEALLSEKAARILAAVIPVALKQNAIAEFTEILGTILSGENESLLKVTGPEDILSAIKAGMALREGIIEFVRTDDVEVTLIAGDTMVQTQFSGWAERLQASMKAE